MAIIVKRSPAGAKKKSVTITSRKKKNNDDDGGKRSCVLSDPGEDKPGWTCQPGWNWDQNGDDTSVGSSNKSYSNRGKNERTSKAEDGDGDTEKSSESGDSQPGWTCQPMWNWDLEDDTSDDDVSGSSKSSSNRGKSEQRSSSKAEDDDDDEDKRSRVGAKKKWATATSTKKKNTYPSWNWDLEDGTSCDDGSSKSFSSSGTVTSIEDDNDDNKSSRVTTTTRAWRKCENGSWRKAEIRSRKDDGSDQRVEEGVTVAGNAPSNKNGASSLLIDEAKARIDELDSELKNATSVSDELRRKLQMYKSSTTPLGTKLRIYRKVEEAHDALVGANEARANLKSVRESLRPSREQCRELESMYEDLERSLVEWKSRTETAERKLKALEAIVVHPQGTFVGSSSMLIR